MNEFKTLLQLHIKKCTPPADTVQASSSTSCQVTNFVTAAISRKYELDFSPDCLKYLKELSFQKHGDEKGKEYFEQWRKPLSYYNDKSQISHGFNLLMVLSEEKFTYASMANFWFNLVLSQTDKENMRVYFRPLDTIYSKRTMSEPPKKLIKPEPKYYDTVEETKNDVFPVWCSSLDQIPPTPGEITSILENGAGIRTNLIFECIKDKYGKDEATWIIPARAIAIKCAMFPRFCIITRLVPPKPQILKKIIVIVEIPSDYTGYEASNYCYLGRHGRGDLHCLLGYWEVNWKCMRWVESNNLFFLSESVLKMADEKKLDDEYRCFSDVFKFLTDFVSEEIGTSLSSEPIYGPLLQYQDLGDCSVILVVCLNYFSKGDMTEKSKIQLELTQEDTKEVRKEIATTLNRIFHSSLKATRTRIANIIEQDSIDWAETKENIVLSNTELRQTLRTKEPYLVDFNLNTSSHLKSLVKIKICQKKKVEKSHKVLILVINGPGNRLFICDPLSVKQEREIILSTGSKVVETGKRTFELHAGLSDDIYPVKFEIKTMEDVTRKWVVKLRELIQPEASNFEDNYVPSEESDSE